jgi:hypothetical protein
MSRVGQKADDNEQHDDYDDSNDGNSNEDGCRGDVKARGRDRRLD